MDARQEKGLQIAATTKLVPDDGMWLVPSQAGKGKYVVDADANQCTCPDFEARQATCKHLYAVSYTIEREYSNNGQTQTVTETVTVKKTYKQEWPAYNAAQVNEKDQFQQLLHELCKGVGEPSQTMGRPRLPFEDMIFSACFKVYSTVSGRRFMSDLRDAKSKGHISKLPCYNSIFNYFENEALNSKPNWGLGTQQTHNENARWRNKTALWRQMYHLYSYNTERFMAQYHKRSNVETAFHMIKAKFGIALRSKTKTAQINEALCKVLAHNICCLIQSMFELGVKPEFWAQTELTTWD